MRSGLVTEVSKLVMANTVYLITANSFITPAHSQACKGTPTNTSRLNIFRVGEIRSRKCAKRRRGNRAERRTGDRRSNCRSSRCSRCRAPLVIHGGGFSTPVGGASSVLRLVRVPRDVIAPLELRIT